MQIFRRANDLSSKDQTARATALFRSQGFYEFPYFVRPCHVAVYHAKLASKLCPGIRAVVPLTCPASMFGSTGLGLPSSVSSSRHALQAVGT